jgi:glycosyltransferase involved in cell wall biosynthesis
LADRVHILGHVTDEELEAWLHRAEVLVSLSKLEAFGRVLYDALAYGCRVVCSDVPAHIEAAIRFPAAVSLVRASEPPTAVAAHVQLMLGEPMPVVDLSDFAPEQVARRLAGVYGAIVQAAGTSP